MDCPLSLFRLIEAETLDRRLGRLPEIMGGRPYAVNIVSLAENPFRETQLAWIKQHKPRFVVIAGGDLSPLRELIEGGMEVIYIAPDEALLRLALEAGVRYVICEGYEAGGHVGRHSTLTLAQRVMDLKRLTGPVPKLSHIPCRGNLQSGDRIYRRHARGGCDSDGHRVSRHPGDRRNRRPDRALSAYDPRIAAGRNGRFGPGHRTSGALLEDPEDGRGFVSGEGVCRGWAGTSTPSARE